MAEPIRTLATNALDSVDGDADLEAVGDEELVARVSQARNAGKEDPRGVEELLRRAAEQNKAALDRLAR
jgi:hypothetical protein